MPVSAFRNCQVAAPLKLWPRPGPAQVLRVFPQLSSCGPIEATSSSVRYFGVYHFPQLSSCGPIEASPAARSAAGSGGFPQLSSCGPIEACYPWRHRHRIATFRNCQVAAPLKLTDRLIEVGGTFSFPQLSSCGPIEALRRLGLKGADKAFPQLSSCGPIEASGVANRAQSQARQLSATVKLRPH